MGEPVGTINASGLARTDQSELELYDFEPFDYCPKCGQRLTPVRELIDASYIDSEGRYVSRFVEGLTPKDRPA